jgi:hypothetical protein
VAAEKPYIVTFRESRIITERVYARSAAEAVRLVKDGEGERLGEEADDYREPTSHKAVIEKED